MFLDRLAIATLRIVLGWGFLSAGVTKFLAYWSDAPFSAAAFLETGTTGTWPGTVAGAAIVNPTHGLWAFIAANPNLLAVVNFLVVFGEIAVGAALIVGLATRYFGILAAVMMGLITIAAWDFQLGLVNLTVFSMVVALVLVAVDAGRAYGLDAKVVIAPSHAFAA